MINVRITGTVSMPEPWGRYLRTVIIVIALIVVVGGRETLAAVLGL
ncbi:hypothetical protein ABZW49_28245 [Nonomuraea wenchangensis]